MIEDVDRRKKRLTMANTGNITSITTASGIRSQGTVTPSPYSAKMTTTSTTKYYNPYAKNNSNSNKNHNNDHSAPTNPHQRRVINNPYQRKETQYNSAPSSSNNTTYQSSSSSNENFDSYRSSLAKQHPHRAGRIRVDRQFTTALSISSAHDYDDEDNDDNSHGQNNNLMRDSYMKSNSSNVSIDGSLSMKRPVHDNKSDDGDEDDDDDLLLFIPFGKGD